jgi:hypothetical protein
VRGCGGEEEEGGGAHLAAGRVAFLGRSSGSGSHLAGGATFGATLHYTEKFSNN